MLAPPPPAPPTSKAAGEKSERNDFLLVFGQKLVALLFCVDGERSTAVNKAPHTSASGPSAGIGTTLGLSCGSVLYFIMNQPNNIQSLCGAHALAR